MRMTFFILLLAVTAGCVETVIRIRKQLWGEIDRALSKKERDNETNYRIMALFAIALLVIVKGCVAINHCEDP